eukprot:c17440_g1_i1.p2 GENE.c17440_g1_i1~~c17440_g1_i1.p2  ORF type:complete len:279 (+),score=45.65 c17440_g1_i1:1157-1993(+)
MFIVLFAYGGLITASVIYFAEGGRWDPATSLWMRRSPGQVPLPQASPFSSIPYCFWWVAVTFASVGYGDRVPSTYGGYALGTLAMYYGVLVVTMPISALGLYFVSEFVADERAEKRKRRIDEIAARALHHMLTPSAEFNQVVMMQKAWNKWFHEMRIATSPMILEDGWCDKEDVRTVIRNELASFVRNYETQLRSLVRPPSRLLVSGAQRCESADSGNTTPARSPASHLPYCTLGELVRQTTRDAVKQELGVLEQFITENILVLKQDLEQVRKCKPRA